MVQLAMAYADTKAHIQSTNILKRRASLESWNLSEIQCVARCPRGGVLGGHLQAGVCRLPFRDFGIEGCGLVHNHASRVACFVF